MEKIQQDRCQQEYRPSTAKPDHHLAIVIKGDPEQHAAVIVEIRQVVGPGGLRTLENIPARTRSIIWMDVVKKVQVSVLRHTEQVGRINRVVRPDKIGLKEEK